jgi:hypothetical protein
VKGTGPSGGAIAAAVIAFLVFATAGTVGLVAWKRHVAEPAPATSAAASSAIVTPQPSAALPAPVVLADPGAAPSASASSPAATPPSSSPAPGFAPGLGPGRRLPPGQGRPGGAPAPTKPPPSNGNPFGDDRRG